MDDKEIAIASESEEIVIENENNSTNVIQADTDNNHDEASPSENSEYQALLDEVKSLKEELSRHFQQSDTITEGGVNEIERYLDSEESITGRLLKSLKG